MTQFIDMIQCPGCGVYTLELVPYDVKPIEVEDATAATVGKMGCRSCSTSTPKQENKLLGQHVDIEV